MPHRCSGAGASADCATNQHRKQTPRTRLTRHGGRGPIRYGAVPLRWCVVPWAGTADEGRSVTVRFRCGGVSFRGLGLFRARAVGVLVAAVEGKRKQDKSPS